MQRDDEQISLKNIQFETIKIKRLGQSAWNSRIISAEFCQNPSGPPSVRIRHELKKMAHPANAGPPRPQTVAKEEEIRQQVKDMLVAKIIRPS